MMMMMMRNGRWPPHCRQTRPQYGDISSTKMLSALIVTLETQSSDDGREGGKVDQPDQTPMWNQAVNREQQEGSRQKDC